MFLNPCVWHDYYIIHFDLINMFISYSNYPELFFSKKQHLVERNLVYVLGLYV